MNRPISWGDNTLFGLWGHGVKGHMHYFVKKVVFVDISRSVRWFYIRLGMRIYPGGIILCLDFRVTGSKVTEAIL